MSLETVWRCLGVVKTQGGNVLFEVLDSFSRFFFVFAKVEMTHTRHTEVTVVEPVHKLPYGKT